MSSLLALQLLLRGQLLIANCLVLVRMLGLRSLQGAVAVGAVFTLLSGVTPLLLPNPYIADAMLWAHMCEVTSSNFLYSAMIAWLWGEPSPAWEFAVARSGLGRPHDLRSDFGSGGAGYCCTSRMSTTSESVWPRTTASLLPSHDQWKSQMCSDLNEVICLPGEPSSGCCQRLSTPLSRAG
jgi:hypothetical protein